jgi:hypothetical protein
MVGVDSIFNSLRSADRAPFKCTRNLFPDNRLRHSLSPSSPIGLGAAWEAIRERHPGRSKGRCDCQMFPINIGKTSSVAGARRMSPLEFRALGNCPCAGACAARTGQTPARATCHAPARTGRNDRLHNSRTLRAAFHPVRGRYRLCTLKRYGVGQSQPRTSV